MFVKNARLARVIIAIKTISEDCFFADAGLGFAGGLLTRRFDGCYDAG